MQPPTWTDFHLFLQKELTTNIYKTKRPTKRSSIYWFVSSIIPRDMYVRASEKGGKMRWRACPTAANHSHEWTNRFSTGMEIQQIKQNRAIFVWMKKNKDFIKVRRKQSYNKHLISRLTSQYGWVFLLVEFYFGLPKGSPKYCWLVNLSIYLFGKY